MQAATLNDAQPASFFVFNHFPVDIGLLILGNCSPYDLAQLTLTSGRLRALIPKVWNDAYNNLARGACPRLPTCPEVEASGNYSHGAYASWIFGGGLCTYCSKPTSDLPCDFLFRCRACSVRGRVLETFFNPNVRSTNIIDAPKKYETHPFSKWIPRRLVPSHGTSFIYSRLLLKKAGRELEQAVNPNSNIAEFRQRTVTELKEEYAKRERSRPALEQNAQDLMQWNELYLTEKEVVEHTNRKFIQVVCVAESVKLQQLLRCPTMKTVLAVFSRDLTLITLTVWMEHRVIILAELEDLIHANATRNKVKCPYCDRLVKIVGISDHIIQATQNATPFLGRSNDKNCCIECPVEKRPRLFTPAGLELHQKECHSSSTARTECHLCSIWSDRMFTAEGLQKHFKAKHGAE
ncbi:hypothetical protein C8F01DRAFT_1176099 [Mycena amicta]|nr:hypothetical protein C8F01DRAFT_1176099 [Mycena amicta]